MITGGVFSSAYPQVTPSDEKVLDDFSQMMERVKVRMSSGTSFGLENISKSLVVAQPVIGALRRQLTAFWPWVLTICTSRLHSKTSDNSDLLVHWVESPQVRLRKQWVLHYRQF